MPSPDADTMTMEEAEIADLCDRLSALLRDPHHGLMVWLAMRREFAEKLREKLATVTTVEPVNCERCGYNPIAAPGEKLCAMCKAGV